jgi:hypothetical protein
MTALYGRGGHNHLGPCRGAQNREDWKQMQSESMPMTNKSISTGCSIGLTCLKWSADGELSAFDLRLVLGRLARVDRHVAAIWGNHLDLDPCPSIS